MSLLCTCEPNNVDINIFVIRRRLFLSSQSQVNKHIYFYLFGRYYFKFKVYMCNAVGCQTAFSFVQGHVTEVSDTTTAIKLAPVWVFPFYRQEFGGYYGFVESVYKYIKVNIMLYLPYYFLFKHINAWFTRACLNVMCDDK